MRTWGSAAAVIAALRDDAAAERERLERDSSAALAALRESGGALQTGAAGSADRLDCVRRALADVDAAQEWDEAVAAAADRDAWIGEVASLGRRAIAAAPDPQQTLMRLACEAVRELPDTDCIVVVPKALAAGVGTWRSAVESETGKRITIETGAFAAGCVARTADGRVTFDNTVEARERRARTAWRMAVARIYDRAIAARGAPAEVA